MPRHLTIHPHAAPAFETLATLGTPLAVGSIRAVEGKNSLLVFGGLCWLLNPDPCPPVRIEEDPGRAEIERIAWDEVRSVMTLLASSMAMRREYALQIARNTPGHLLPKFSLHSTRDPRQLMTSLNVPLRDRIEKAEPSIIQRARMRYRGER